MDNILKHGLLGGCVTAACYYSVLFEEHHRRLLHDKTKGGHIGSYTYRQHLSNVAVWRVARYLMFFGAFLVSRSQ